MFHTEALHLEELLAGHGMAVRVGQASLSTDAIRFPIQLGLGVTTRRLLALSRDLAQEAGYSRCRLRREGRTLFLELPRGEGAGLRYGDLLELGGSPQAGSALLGLTESGTLATFNVTDAMPHLALTGGAGAGKSELLRVLALGIAANHAPRFWRLALLESHPGPLRPLHALPHCWATSEQPETALGWLVRLVTEMTEREQERIVWPRVLALVDDAESLLARGGSVVRAVLRALLKRGAAVGIHVALASGSPGALGDLLPLFPLHLDGEDAPAPGRFALRHASQEVPLLAARLEEREVAAVVERMVSQRIRLVARRGEEGAP